MKQKWLLLTSVMLLTSMNVNGEESREDDEEGQFMLGIMGARDNSIYIEGEDQTQVIPFIQARWGRFFFQGPSIGAFLYEQDNMSFSASVDLSGIGDDDRDKSPALADMQKLDSAFFGAINYDYESEDFGEFGISLGADISGSHDGQRAEVSWSYPMHVGGWMVSPELSVEWVSEEVNQYYYGVTQQDVTTTRHLYTPDAGVNYEFGIMAMYPFMQQHAILIRAGYSKYSDEVSNSPIVDEDTSTDIALGYVYRF